MSDLLVYVGVTSFQVNALSGAFLRELQSLWQDVNHDSKVRGVLLKSEQKYSNCMDIVLTFVVADLQPACFLQASTYGK